MSLPRPLTIGFVALCLSACSSEQEPEKPTVTEAIHQAATALSPQPEVTQIPVTAEIMDIVESSSRGTWAVAVRFPNGIINPCAVEVKNRHSGELLVRDEIRSTRDGNFIHETQFQFRGQASGLAITVSETGSGAVLASN